MVWGGDMRTFPHRHFEVPEDPKALGRLFSVPDFVGDACKALASRVRGAVAAVTFDDFHKVHLLPPLGSPTYHPCFPQPRHPKSLPCVLLCHLPLRPHILFMLSWLAQMSPEWGSPCP